jgi:hypothetical protein
MAWNRLALWCGSGKSPYVISEQTVGSRAGFLACSCWGWKKHRNCKHVKAIRAMIPAGTTDKRLVVLNIIELKRVVSAGAEA